MPDQTEHRNGMNSLLGRILRVLGLIVGAIVGWEVGVNARLPALLALHYRYRFDPVGLGDTERARLTAEARTWLAAHAGAPR